MKETPLTQLHIDLGARMMPFSGYNMPVSYSGINEEHLRVRESVGLFDVSHMGQFIISGKESLELLQKISSNDASKLVVGQAQYGCFPNENGGIIDDFIAYKLEDDKYMLVVNAANMEKDYKWIEQANEFDCKLENHSDNYALQALQGPRAAEVLSKITDVKVDQIPFYYFATGSVAGVDDIIISATGYTGSGGFELYIKNQDAVKIWNEIMTAGKEADILPVGLGARDTLRLEMAYCLYGNDIDDTTSPIEAGLSWITKTKKEADFFSKDIFIKQREQGVSRKLVGFIVDDRRVPRNGYDIVNDNGEIIGKVTSGTMSPCLEKPIGMGYVSREYAKAGSEIAIQIRNKKLKASVVKTPFYKQEI
jgi:aminomethyltransferase